MCYSTVHSQSIEDCTCAPHRLIDTSHTKPKSQEHIKALNDYIDVLERDNRTLAMIVHRKNKKLSQLRIRIHRRVNDM
jgi:hypothetical protein